MIILCKFYGFTLELNADLEYNNGAERKIRKCSRSVWF